MFKALGFTFIFVMYLLFYSGAAYSEENYIVRVDGRANCCNDRNHSCSVQVVLDPGRYVFWPSGGAISRWGDDKTAAGQGEKGAWEWFVYIEVGDNLYSLGNQLRRISPQDALSKVQTKEKMITITEQTQIKLWVEDSWEGNDYCEDNRGEMEVGITQFSDY